MYPRGVCLRASKARKIKNLMNDVAKETGRRLRDERIAKGWSQSQLATATGWRSGKPGGISPGAIGNYEQGTRKIPRHRAKIFAELFGLPSAYFLGEITKHEAKVIAALRATM